MIINNLKELTDRGKLEYNDIIIFWDLKYRVSQSHLYELKWWINGKIFKDNNINEIEFCSDAYWYTSTWWLFPSYKDNDYAAAYRVAVKIYTDILLQSIDKVYDEDNNVYPKLELEDENIWHPSNPNISIWDKDSSETEPQAWNNNWNWYYNWEWAMQEAKYLWKKIPTKEQWTEIVKDYWDNWQRLSKELNMPFAGYRNWNNANYFYQSTYAFYWSSTPTTTVAYSLYFDTTDVYPANYGNRGDGFSLRCLKDNTKQMKYKVLDTIKIIWNKSQHHLPFEYYIISDVYIHPECYDQSYVKVHWSNMCIWFYDIEKIEWTYTWCTTTVNTVTESVINTDTILKTNIKHMKTYNEIQIEKFFSDKKNADTIEMTIDKLEWLRILLRDTSKDIGKIEYKVMLLLSNINNDIDKWYIKTLKQKLKEYPSLIEYVENYITTPIADVINTEVKEVTPDVFFKR